MEHYAIMVYPVINHIRIVNVRFAKVSYYQNQEVEVENLHQPKRMLLILR